MDESTLARWAANLAAGLDVEQVVDVDTVLRVAADAAHGVMRPAAPLTTFLVGLAIGQGGAGPARVADVLEHVRSAIETWDADFSHQQEPR